MPSPVGHALGGLAAGWLTDRRGGGPRVAGLYALAGIAAGLDLRVGGHRGPRHGLGAVVGVGALTWIAASRTGPSPLALRLAAAVAAAYASHVLLDWLGSDSRPPIGVMALWPF